MEPTPYRENAVPVALANRDTPFKRAAFLASVLASLFAVCTALAVFGPMSRTSIDVGFEVFLYASASFLLPVIVMLFVSHFVGSDAFDVPGRHPRLATLAVIWWPVTIVGALVCALGCWIAHGATWVRHGS